MRDRVYWKPERNFPLENGGTATVYIRGVFAPFCGWIASPNTVWSCPAYIRVKGKRVKGYVGQLGENDFATFNRYAKQ